jgi:hypothetical protein
MFVRRVSDRTTRRTGLLDELFAELRTLICGRHGRPPGPHQQAKGCLVGKHAGGGRGGFGGCLGAKASAFPLTKVTSNSQGVHGRISVWGVPSFPGLQSERPYVGGYAV